MEEDRPNSSQFPDKYKYKMNNKRRGIALIFNHTKFKVPDLRLAERIGTEKDGKKLTVCFKKLGFEVRTLKDKIFSEIKEYLLKVSKEDHSENDCLVIVVLSHGDYGILYAKDQAYEEEELWTPFTAEKCKTLEGKPKLYFIQACRGETYDPGVSLVEVKSSKVFQPSYEVDDYAAGAAGDSHKAIQSYVLQLESDFLVAHATVPDHYAWKGGTTNAWFINELCAELGCEPTDHLLNILHRVGFKVAVEYESNTPGNPISHGKKQMPCISTALKKLVFFY